MNDSAKIIAENATFQAFFNSYIREAGTGHYIRTEDWIIENRSSILLDGPYIIELELLQQDIRIAIEVNYLSKVGRHVLGAALKYCQKGKQWYREEKLTLMMTLIQELHLITNSNSDHDLASHYDELILRLIGSYQTMKRYIEARMEDSQTLYSENSSFIETEQSLLFGHWFHPTPKSRQGMSYWQHKSFAPELAGSFQLHYFQVDSSMIKEECILSTESASDLLKTALIHSSPTLHIPKEAFIIPMHPLQAQWLLQQDHVKDAMNKGLIKSLGTLGKNYTATSSLRTVYRADEEYMLKFSIPVKVTNSLRVNQQHELKAGVVIARLWRKLSFNEYYPAFQMIDDPGYVTVDFPNQKESGFEVIIRSNPFPSGRDEGISSIAAIVQDPLPNQQSRLYHLILKVVKRDHLSIEEVSMKWFENYWCCAVEPLIRLYDEYGIALEAHQQNSVLDVSEGYPKTYFYRDNQGYYLSEHHKQVLCQMEPSLLEAPELFYENSLIQERFTYYLVMNQLFSVIYRFGADGLISEATLLEWSLDKLKMLEGELVGQGKQFVSSLLNEEKLSYKANLLTRLHDVDELTAKLEQAIYTKIDNPFLPLQKEEKCAKVISYTY
ncbi:IucA/IucC family protein [Metabacillus litoralis]|uniref:IucA/IucC family protein n=1 Tax=Metabacillus litoralis TaxID=152268 RepID=UPI000EF5DB11|nr:IucA/IucC family protein [Metabacillus litoralis]